ncbi:glycosyltransferase [Actinomyces sp.]|uniref:glycosyltransferase n=1 Tax=Actinomyces sp. TaxID=29317 RepID=UPI00291117FB|nr:glycosyltransferase [Actinomyces sp.]MDU6678716.1 glycosyltransferase [Actinomyces sp.]
MPRMIFHAPYALNPDAIAASAIRPVKMLNAFKEIGYDVFDLTGTSRERKRKLKSLRKHLEAGVEFAFMYSESATIPAMIGDPNHTPHMMLDAHIFREICRHDIPTAVFYRDLYWAYEEYFETVKRPLADLMRLLYHYELAIYRRYMDIIFLPSAEMANELPQLSASKIVALPSGGEIVDLGAPAEPVNMFYVGNVSSHYRLHEIVKAVRELPDVTFTICTGRDSWQQVKDEYPADAPNIHIVHARGDELNRYYESSNIAVLTMEPSHYRSFAMPFKLFEYVGRGKPILATNGTLAARVIHENGWGWTVDNSKEELIKVLRELSTNPREIVARTEKVCTDRANNTWLARAQTVSETLVEG